MNKNKNWFEIDRAGLAQILARKGKEFAIFELVQNSWDERAVTYVAVSLSVASFGYATLYVKDNAPEGFMTHPSTDTPPIDATL